MRDPFRRPRRPARVARLLATMSMATVALIHTGLGPALAQSAEDIEAARRTPPEAVRRLVERGGADAGALGLAKSATERRDSRFLGMPLAGRIRAARRAYDPKVIYGPDDRLDYGLARARHPELTPILDASVALFAAADVTSVPEEKVRLDTRTLKERQRLCAGEAFESQAAGSFCSGTLIGPDLVLTAGHCVREISNDPQIPALDAVAFVFGFHARDAGDAGATVLPAGHVFLGREPHTGVLDSVSKEDWAIVRLNRPVPVSIARPVTAWHSHVAAGGEVFVVGYPSRLPLKYAPNAIVRDVGTGPYFRANLDTFGGSSGAGVYDAKERRLVGILVRGEPDYVLDDERNCNVVNICPTTGCSGEEVTRISVVGRP